MAYDDLGNRLLTDPKTSHKLMKQMIMLGIVEILRKG